MVDHYERSLPNRVNSGALAAVGVVLGVLVSATLDTKTVKAVNVRLDTEEAGVLARLVGVISGSRGSEKSEKSNESDVELHGVLMVSCASSVHEPGLRVGARLARTWHIGRTSHRSD